MRTTLSLDDDLASLLNKEMRHSGTSFKETVNHYLRAIRGFMISSVWSKPVAPVRRASYCLPSSVPAKQKPRKPFKVDARPLGLRAGLSYDNIGEMLETLEGPAHT